jgi:hypothetical protein
MVVIFKIQVMAQLHKSLAAGMVPLRMTNSQLAPKSHKIGVR